MEREPAYIAAEKMKRDDKPLSIIELNEAIRNNRKIRGLRGFNSQTDYFAYYFEGSDWIVLEIFPREGGGIATYRFFERSKHLDKFMEFFNASHLIIPYELMCSSLSSIGVSRPPRGLMEVRQSQGGIEYLEGNIDKYIH